MSSALECTSCRQSGGNRESELLDGKLPHTPAVLLNARVAVSHFIVSLLGVIMLGGALGCVICELFVIDLRAPALGSTGDAMPADKSVRLRL